MRINKDSPIKPYLVCLCNLNFLGLGYLLIGQKKRWFIAFVASLSMLLIAHFTNAPTRPWLWMGIYLVFLIGMALDMGLLIKKSNSVQERILKKSLTSLILITLMIGIVFGGGFFYYRNAGEMLYRQGVIAYEDDDMQTAFKDLYSVSTLYRLSLDASVLEAQKMIDEVSLITSIKNHIEIGDLATASAMIKTFKILYPNSTKIEQVEKVDFDSRLELAIQSTGSGEYETSLQKVADLGTEYPTLYKERKEEIDQVLATNYFEWGRDLIDNGHYFLAIGKLNKVMEYSNSSELLAKVQDEKEAIIPLIAKDTGEDGQKILSHATITACGGSYVLDPTIGILEGEPKKVKVCPASTVSVPQEFIAEKPGNLTYVIKRSDGSSLFGRCTYYTTFKNGVVEARQLNATVNIIEVQTGRIVFQKIFYGSTPICPGTYQFTNSLQLPILGGNVSDQEITDWINEVL